jgi:hypothetical protein
VHPVSDQKRNWISAIDIAVKHALRKSDERPVLLQESERMEQCRASGVIVCVHGVFSHGRYAWRESGRQNYQPDRHECGRVKPRKAGINTGNNVVPTRCLRGIGLGRCEVEFVAQ